MSTNFSMAIFKLEFLFSHEYNFMFLLIHIIVLHEPNFFIVFVYLVYTFMFNNSCEPFISMIL